jgi:hypothetical protein
MSSIELHLNVVDLITRSFFPYLIFHCFPFPLLTIYEWHLSLFFFSLANYLWMAWLPLTKWCNNSFLSASNHAVILFLFFLSLICHQSHRSISFTLYINISFLLSSWVFPFQSCHQSRKSISLALKKIRKQQSWLSPTFDKRMKETTVVIDGVGSSLFDLSLFSLFFLTIYEWRDYRWQNDAAIISFVHLITQWFFPCFSFPWRVINHNNQFSFTLYINISFLLSSLVVPFESSHQSRQSISLFKKMNKGNNRRVMTTTTARDKEGIDRCWWIHGKLSKPLIKKRKGKVVHANSLLPPSWNIRHSMVQNLSSNIRHHRSFW